MNEAGPEMQKEQRREHIKARLREIFGDNETEVNNFASLIEENQDDETVRHELNVGVGCKLAADYLKEHGSEDFPEFTEDDGTLLIKAGLCHDLGKKIFGERIHDASTGDNPKLIQKHVRESLKIIREKGDKIGDGNIFGRISEIVAMVHEVGRGDISRYPRDNRENNHSGEDRRKTPPEELKALEKYAKIVAIVDRYCAMVEDRKYRKDRITPEEALEKIKNQFPLNIKLAEFIYQKHQSGNFKIVE